MLKAIDSQSHSRHRLPVPRLGTAMRKSLVVLIAGAVYAWSIPYAVATEPPAVASTTAALAHASNGSTESVPLTTGKLHSIPQTGSVQVLCSATVPRTGWTGVADSTGTAFIKPHRPTIALALGGGGVRGAAHVGVLKVLEREGIPVDFIVGNSMGAVVGGMYAAGVSLDDLEHMFLDRSMFKAFIPVPVSWKLMSIPPRMLLRSARRAAGMRTGFVGLYSTNKLAEFVNSRVPPERQNIEQTAIPFAAVATNLLDGKVYALDSGNLGKALQASSAVPFYVKPIPYDGKLLLDGALRANVPTVQARQSGADIVISVNVDEDLQTVNKDSLRSMRHYGNRLMSMMLAGIDEHQGEIADLEIRPTLVSMPLYSRSDKDAIRAMIAGAQAAASAVPEIKLLLNSKLAHEPR